MRDEQADPADHARDGDDGGRGRDCGGEQEGAFAARRDAEGKCGLVAERKQGHAPPHQPHNRERGKDHGQHAGEIGPGHRPQAAQEPESNLRQLTQRIGDGLQEAETRRENGGYGEPRQHQSQNPSAVVQSARERIGEEEAEERAECGGSLDQQRRAAEENDGDARAERGALGDAEEAGLDQRIAEDHLHHRAASRQRHAQENRGEDPGQAQVQDQLLRKGIVAQKVCRHPVRRRESSEED